MSNEQPTSTPPKTESKETKTNTDTNEGAAVALTLLITSLTKKVKELEKRVDGVIEETQHHCKRLNVFEKGWNFHHRQIKNVHLSLEAITEIMDEELEEFKKDAGLKKDDNESDIKSKTHLTTKTFTSFSDFISFLESKDGPLGKDK